MAIPAIFRAEGRICPGTWPECGLRRSHDILRSHGRRAEFRLLQGLPGEESLSGSGRRSRYRASP